MWGQKCLMMNLYNYRKATVTTSPTIRLYFRSSALMGYFRIFTSWTTWWYATPNYMKHLAVTLLSRLFLSTELRSIWLSCTILGFFLFMRGKLWWQASFYSQYQFLRCPTYFMAATLSQASPSLLCFDLTSRWQRALMIDSNGRLGYFYLIAFLLFQISSVVGSSLMSAYSHLQDPKALVSTWWRSFG